MTSHSDIFDYNACIVRPVSSALLKALRMEEPENPIDIKRAQEQHKSYTDTLKQLLPHVFELPEEPDLADSNFVEDTTVVIDDTAIIPIMGALERRPETTKIKETLRQCGKHIVEMHEPGTLDGGDVMFTGHHIFVGLSRRTNQSGVDQLAAAFPKYKVHAIEVSAGLHLKSVMSCFDDKTILIANTEYGRKAAAAIEHAVGHGTYEIVFVPDVAASNILRIKNAVVVQDHLPNSIGIINKLAEAKQVHVKLTDSSELWKVDGLLTCCSVLFKVK
eukprot:TRINITY_DN6048_c0_g1_i1.p1 TRINITY_DN6048_c0_g1~~TRINITY_DN6048_c0_g1_i1.p1  ORF type:complete len:275 (-),score=27.71 TRINITY_DN6048_c0_g1_i1:16-840(-)